MSLFFVHVPKFAIIGRASNIFHQIPFFPQKTGRTSENWTHDRSGFVGMGQSRHNCIWIYLIVYAYIRVYIIQLFK